VLYAVFQQGSIGELREGVVKCLVDESRLELLAPGNVVKVADDRVYAWLMEQIGRRRLDPSPGAIFVTDAQLAGCDRPLLGRQSQEDLLTLCHITRMDQIEDTHVTRFTLLVTEDMLDHCCDEGCASTGVEWDDYIR
jgi:hypothetical protein